MSEDILQYIDTEWAKLTNYLPKDEKIRIGLPNPFVSPSADIFGGDQFYWDTYFIILGLLESDKLDLARGMVDNLIYMFDRFDIIPNRNRMYNLGGSQPPLLTSMAIAGFEKSKDRKWFRQAMKTAEKELSEHWLYREKLEKHVFPDGLVRYCDHYLNHITAEHESGWDMTSRFQSKCMNFAPIDLNCLIYKYEKDLGEFYAEEGETVKAKEYKERATKRAKFINDLMWDEQKGYYFDFNEAEKRINNFYSLAGFFPLWVGIANDQQAARIVENLDLFEFPGGLATTQKEDLAIEGWQWDYPNGWAPLQLIAVEGLAKYGYQEEARRIALKWLMLVNQKYEETGKIFEKYNVVDYCLPKDERYQNQEGFGWTNGVFVALLKEFDVELSELSREFAGSIK